LNLLLLLVITWLPFPTALIAEHLGGPHADQKTAGIVYSASLLAIAIVFNLLWRYAIRIGAVGDSADVGRISRQYAIGPILYAALVAIANWSADWCLVVSALYAMFFALPPSVTRRLATTGKESVDRKIAGSRERKRQARSEEQEL
jgi:uncharacterized membrane protein